MDKFEYKTVILDAENILSEKVDKSAFQNELNELGSQGWELINSFPSAHHYGKTKFIISIFKRKIQ